MPQAWWRGLSQRTSLDGEPPPPLATRAVPLPVNGEDFVPPYFTSGAAKAGAIVNVCSVVTDVPATLSVTVATTR